MSSHYGKRTTAQDGKTYRSKFEADFVDKFLIPSGLEYVYEIKYPDSNMTCDFWLPQFDVWIECAYHYVSMRHEYETLTQGRRIYLPRAKFKDKDYIKTQKGKWDADNKQWYVVYEGYPLTNLHRFMEESRLQTIMETDGKAFRKGYDQNLLSKILDRKCNVLLVNNEDLGYKDLAHLVCAKENLIVLKNIAAKSLNYSQSKGIGTNLSDLYRTTEENREQLAQEQESFMQRKFREIKEQQKAQNDLAAREQLLANKEKRFKDRALKSKRFEELTKQAESHRLNEREANKLEKLKKLMEGIKRG